MSRRPSVAAKGTVALGAVVAVTLAASLAGCAPTVSATPAPGANDPLCAAVTVRLPDRIGTLDQRDTDAQATGAWGDPEQVLLTCGVKAPAVSSLTCIAVDGIDWLVDDRKAPLYVFTSYGRKPAIDVAYRTTKVSGETVLAELADAVRETKPTGRKCR